jgi:hypothetical protein
VGVMPIFDLYVDYFWSGHVIKVRFADWGMHTLEISEQVAAIKQGWA